MLPVSQHDNATTTHTHHYTVRHNSQLKRITTCTWRNWMFLLGIFGIGIFLFNVFALRPGHKKVTDMQDPAPRPIPKVQPQLSKEDIKIEVKPQKTIPSLPAVIPTPVQQQQQPSSLSTSLLPFLRARRTAALILTHSRANYLQETLNSLLAVCLTHFEK